ncbi:MAG: type II toxin-antitoxin system VapC family toxin [Spirochaetota bacterium]
MKYLLDTHVLLWWLANNEELTADHQRIIRNKRNICFISAATVWEISIKTGLRKLVVAEEYLEVARSQGFLELPISWTHTQGVKQLPDHHKDPFDRLLISQALSEGMTLLTVDENIRKYQLPTA